MALSAEELKTEILTETGLDVKLSNLGEYPEVQSAIETSILKMATAIVGHVQDKAEVNTGSAFPVVPIVAPMDGGLTLYQASLATGLGATSGGTTNWKVK